MKRFAMALALSLMGASAAMADGRHEWSHEPHAIRGPAPHTWSYAPHAWSYAPRPWAYPGEREHAWHDHYGYDRYGYGRYWGVGERLPAPYYARPYWVADYRAYELREPPPGCRWVRVNGGDLVLAAIATGVILEVAHAF